MPSKRSPRKIERKQPCRHQTPSKLDIESKQVIICKITYFTEMFARKDREMKELSACTYIYAWDARCQAGTTNWLKLSSWMQEYIGNGKHYTSCTTCRGLQVHCARANPSTPEPRVRYWRHFNGPSNWCQTQNPRRGSACNIMIKFCNSDVKQNIFKSCKVIKPKKLHINESLKPLRNNILYVMLQAKKKHPSVINSCSSSDGSVVAWLHAASASAKIKYRKIIINPKKELDLFLKQELNTEAMPFIDTWPAF